MCQSEEVAAAVGGGGKGDEKEGRDGAVTCNDVQCGGSDDDTLHERELGSGRGYAEDAVGDPPMVGLDDTRNVR